MKWMLWNNEATHLLTALLASVLLSLETNAAENFAALPAVGSHQLRILSPTLLELTLVTIKDPEPAPVTTWNFVGPNFTFTPPSANQFMVTANGSTVPVTQVGFRRRPVYAPVRNRDLRIGNSIFLQLGVPLVEGQTVSVANPGGSLWNSATIQYTAVVDAQRHNPAIHVNQVGYVPGFSKKAMVGYYLGSLGEMSIPATTFQVLDANSRAVRFTGVLTARRDLGYFYTPTPYQRVYEADFSNFTIPGEYMLQVPGMGVSHKFLLHEGTAAVFARTVALGLYHQRCGTGNELPYTRHEHAACHTALVEVPTMAFAEVNEMLASLTEAFEGEGPQAAPRLMNVNASLYPFTRQGRIDVRGGHHDAGDYSKYTINSAGLIHHLVFAADAFPGVGALDNLGLPESGDGKSDLLQEAKWEADFLVKMQDSDGGFYFLVYPRNRQYEDDVLPEEGDSQVVFPKTTSATAAAVAALAEIGSSPRFRAQFPAEAAVYLDKAQAGWAFLARAIATHGQEGSYQRIGHYGNEFQHSDELAWAAAAMFAATGNQVFHNQLRGWYDPSDTRTHRWGWWRLFEGYGCAARTYAFAARTGRLSARVLDQAWLAKARAEIIASGNDIERFARQNAYGTSFPEMNKAHQSAGWFFSSERAFELAVADRLEPSSSYISAVIGNMNYEGGCNPVNVPYITGLGWQRWREIVHQFAQNDHRTLPPSGFPLGNIQSGFDWLHFYGSELGLLCFPPDGAGSGPYPFYDRWGDSFNTTTEFVVVDLARSLASYASLMAKTSVAGTPYTRSATRISGLPDNIPVERNVTATFDAPGADLNGARIVWEARDQEPWIGPSFTFAAKNSGAQWVEVEALLPDGRRLFCRTNFTATFSTSIPPNSYQSAPLTPTPEFAALYHADGTLADATGKNAVLRLEGNARMDEANVGWMAVRAGKALRFDDLGDKATVTIPSRYLYTNGTSEITLEAMVFVEEHKAWNRESVNLLSLEERWNVSIKWFEDLYSGPHVVGGTMLDLSGMTLAQAMPVGRWHHIAISIFAGGYAVRVNGATVKVVAESELAEWNGASPVLELGNFSGWIDEIAIRGRVGGAPPPVANLAATAISSTQIALSWVDMFTTEQGFRIYRSTDNVNFSEVAQVSSNVTSWTQNSLLPGTGYYFAVRSFNLLGESPEVVASARTFALGTPSGLAATAEASGIRLNWNAVRGATSYRIMRSTSPAGNWEAYESGITSLTYFDSRAPAGIAHYYCIVAVNAFGESGRSASVHAIVP